VLASSKAKTSKQLDLEDCRGQNQTETEEKNEQSDAGGFITPSQRTYVMIGL